MFGKENNAFVGVAIENGVSGAREREFVGVCVPEFGASTEMELASLGGVAASEPVGVSVGVLQPCPLSQFFGWINTFSGFPVLRNFDCFRTGVAGLETKVKNN